MLWYVLHSNLRGLKHHPTGYSVARVSALFYVAAFLCQNNWKAEFPVPIHLTEQISGGRLLAETAILSRNFLAKNSSTVSVETLEMWLHQVREDVGKDEWHLAVE
jgi:hypothetical protein